MTKSRRKFDAAFKVLLALEASRESATVAELAARHGISPQPDFRLEAAADREPAAPGTKNAALEGRARHECRSSPD